MKKKAQVQSKLDRICIARNFQYQDSLLTKKQVISGAPSTTNTDC